VLSRVLERFMQNKRLFAFAGIGILAVFGAQACKKTGKAAAPITITVIGQDWPDQDSRRHRDEEFRRFTKETGIRIEVLPSPETAVEQLVVWRKLLDSHAVVPDVYEVDVIWPAILADELVDLKSYVPAQELAQQFPELISNFTVNGRLVALPHYLNVGLLFYRTDLLRMYGYRAPPATWDELENEAARIQAGERARGRKNFWGFVWQGAPSEPLTCNALEWQASEGGGSIIDNGAVTVNNPDAIRAWERASRWPGTISPPGVVAYEEWDSLNRWQAGEAAFMRNWSYAYIVASARDSAVAGKFGLAALPKGRAGISGTLGGDGFGVSRYSLHPREAATFVRFLCGRNQQLTRSQHPSEPATIPELYSSPSVLAANPYFPSVLQVFRKDLALRPSAGTGKLYPDVSRAYYEAVNSVLTHKKTAETAAAELQRNLTQITGFKAAPTAVNGRLVRDPAGTEELKQ
jgi:trehalose/maltose transport system substrate-binding protein